MALDDSRLLPPTQMILAEAVLCTALPPRVPGVASVTKGWSQRNDMEQATGWPHAGHLFPGTQGCVQGRLWDHKEDYGDDGGFGERTESTEVTVAVESS